MKKKNKLLITVLFLVTLGIINSYAQCSVTSDEDGDLHFYNGHLTSETLTIAYNILDSGDSQGCEDEMYYFVDDNGFEINTSDFPNWLSVTINESSEQISVTCLQNSTGDDRYYGINLKFEDLGSNMGVIQIWVIQDVARTAYTWYPDRDGDGFGDFYGEATVTLSSAIPFLGAVTNNDDKCPDDYSEENSGCLESYENINWIRSESYDITGKLIGASKGYFDDLGKGIQSQTYDTKTGKVWASQTMYDTQGRPALATMSAPITETLNDASFGYKDGFIKNEANNAFTNADFEDNEADPSTVSVETNTLGAYYSDSGPDFQDTTDRPYSKTIYSELNPGTVKQTIGGNKINGEWKQGYTFTVPAAQEMYYVFGHDYFPSNPAIASTYELSSVDTDIIDNINWLKATKSIVQDVHGNEAVVFTDGDGKTLGAARSGTPEIASEEKKYEVLSLIGEQKFVDIHIPEGCENTLSFIGGSSNYKVYNLKTEIPFDTTPTTLSKGFYRIEYTGSTELTSAHQLTYIDGNAIQPVLENEAVGVRYSVNYYDFSLNYYNKIGQLTASLQPKGFNDSCLTSLSATVDHREGLKSTFNYNTLGQLITTTSPDEGTANFKYREDGQIRFSQNSKQVVVEEFSYTNYDELGRPVESGVFEETTTITFSNADNLLGNIITDITIDNDGLPNEDCREQHFTKYDYLTAEETAWLTANTNSTYHSPSFLSGNVARTYNLDENGEEISSSFYSYDVYGRVTWIVQNLEGLGTKTIDYEYDPITSQVLQVIYQKGTPNEKFIHRYTYDEDTQELTKVETSTDGTNYITHADYAYYETGALRRTELAGGLQDIDYVYNLAGQLKSINHPDLVQDEDLNPNGNDLFGLTLDYYTGDYQRDGRFTNPIGTDQYNGNIKSMSWNTKVTDETPEPFHYTYEYNNNNWLTTATFSADGNTQSTAAPQVFINTEITATFNAVATEEVVLQPGFEATASGTLEFSARIDSNNPEGAYLADDYKVYGLEYDANGNIKKLNRNKNTENETNEMDKLTYHYKQDKPNQLLRIEDAVTNPTNADDIKDQTTIENYVYNEIGQLVTNTDEAVGYEYNASGLVTKVYYNNTRKVAFYYNDKNFRTRKVSYADDGETIEKTTDYIRDVAGSVLAIYEDETLVELPIYGASRLGIYKKESETSVYQLTDHLGNVRAVIAKDATGNAMALTSATDYYPFGMPMPNRKFGANGYRYAYQGQEIDPETGKEAFQLRLWDARIGRWLTTDPYRQYSSPYLGMGNNPINGTDPDGGKFFTDYEYTDGSGNTSRVHVDDSIDQLVKVTDSGDWNNILNLQSIGADIAKYAPFLNKYGATAINRPSTLPPFGDLEINYPKYGGDYPSGGINNEEFGNAVGGKVEQNIDQGIFSNTCACRVSHTLNESGAKIPYIKGQTSSSEGKTAWYIFRVVALEKHLTATYGPPSVISSDLSHFEGHTGIIIYDTRGTWSDATGHATLWDGSNRLGGNYSPSFYLSNGVGKLWITD